ncbi:MAG: PEP/pyruvate-binding domain-containing protein [Candidatus Paceibacterota bacterium]|jgi:pyruvate,water dikinase
MYIKNFREISKNDVGIAGGKGASLGEMTQAGIPVPPGFVVLASAFDKFLKDNDIKTKIDKLLDKVDTQDSSAIESCSEEIHNIVSNGSIPENIKEEILINFDNLDTEYVAIRSSATAEDSAIDAWAGQLESYLFINKNNVLESVKKCWASLFSPRALCYRFERGYKGKLVSVAVVVQKMIDSEVAGVCFTVHPVTRDKDQMIAEACWGLGEALVQGSITPDSYVIEKSTLNFIDVSTSEQTKMIVRKPDFDTEERAVPDDKKDKQKLSNEKIKELAKIAINIENHYGKPQDIEWALENNTLYILQARPITTL